MTSEAVTSTTNFIRQIIDEDLENGKHKEIITRFPPEPNGYLHIGHAKSICLNFGIARDYNGRSHLRFDDTNPAKEEQEYIDSIKNDVRWLGFEWDSLYFASDYFSQLYEWALHMIHQGTAYVCDLTPEQIRDYRGSLKVPGKESPYRHRTVEENLALFQQMKDGKFEEGQCCLRAKIDMASPNINMRDPVMYRVMKVHHPRTGNDWCIYPMYDFTHGLSDAIEGITHSICTLEFEDHRPLYDWFLEQVPVPCRPRQIEFARLNLTYTVMSKRKLLELVNKQYVNGWDDPRMPTIAGIRRRGFTPEAIRAFADKIGVTKSNSLNDVALLEYCVREDLNVKAQRRMAVLDPLKVVITNFPEGQVEWLEAENNPEDESAGSRRIPFTRELYIERGDYMEDAPKKWFRFSVGREVRLKHAYYVTCTEAITDADGTVVELRCTYDPKTKGGWSDDGRKVKGTSHWVSAGHARDAEIRLYDHLFTSEEPGKDRDYKDDLNPDSLIVLSGKIEPELAETQPGDRFQFLRQGYFCTDRDHTTDYPVFNRILGLKDSWAKKTARV